MFACGCRSHGPRGRIMAAGTQVKGAQHCEVVVHEPPSTSHMKVVHTPDPPLVFGQYGAIGQQPALDVQKLPPHPALPSGGPPSPAQPRVQPPLHGGPLLLHCPVVPQVCGCEPAHCIAPGLQLPVHVLPTHAVPMQSVGGAQLPVGSQAWIWFGFAHCVCPGLHTPWHAPPTQVCPLHGAGMPHCPLESHVCWLLPEHCIAPGEQTPAQPVALQTKGQVICVCQLPVASHFCRSVPEHRVVPGLQLPEHMPATHACPVQGTGAPHMPPEQLCTALPEH